MVIWFTSGIWIVFVETLYEGEEMFSEDDFILKKSENLLCSLMLKPGKMSKGDLLCS